MDDQPGTKFSLWGGEIYGKNKEVVRNKKLVQEWWDNASKWEKPSLATFELHDEKDGVRLELVHENVPDENAKDIDEGWKDYYLGPLKNYLE
jgi:activator of HSP90 ATPase